MELLIDELTEVAREAIENAAAEAARAAFLASLEREAAAYQEAAYQQAEAVRWRMEAVAAKSNGIKYAVISGLVCFIGGMFAGFAFVN